MREPAATRTPGSVRPRRTTTLKGPSPGLTAARMTPSVTAPNPDQSHASVGVVQMSVLPVREGWRAVASRSHAGGEVPRIDLLYGGNFRRGIAPSLQTASINGATPCASEALHRATCLRKILIREYPLQEGANEPLNG